MPSFRELISLRNLTNVFVRIPIATFLIHIFSHWMFAKSRAEQLVQIFAMYPQFQFPGRAAKDLATIQKMLRFWPPHEGIGEFSLVFTLSLVLFIRLIDVRTVLKSLGFECSSKLLNFVLTPLYASVIPFVFLLPMMRIAEMHIFVLFLNFVHIAVSSYIVYAVWYFAKSEAVVEKTKTE